MRPPAWLTDTIARRFAFTQILTIGATVGLLLLLDLATGMRGHHVDERSALMNEAADLIRVIEAAPAPLRPSLAATAGSSRFQVRWFTAASRTGEALEGIGPSSERMVSAIATETHRKVVIAGPHIRPSEPTLEALRASGVTERYMMAVRFNDASWLVFTSQTRAWGISEKLRLIIGLIILGGSLTLFTAIAARQFARPVKQLAAAVHEFGMNPKMPPIPASGPRELRQVVQTFNDMQAQIQKFIAHRTLMLAAISHDLRTPLTRMRLRGELIVDPEQQARMFRDVDEMHAMVDGALAFFRDDAVAEPTTAFDLPQLLMTIANDYVDQKIDVEYRGPAHAVYTGRPLGLKRAVNNLVENAIKHATPPEIDLLCEEQAYVVVIRDQGPGIPDTAMGSVFLPYYRVEKSRNRMTGGVGLGLTVAQAIVQSHGGEILLKNPPCGGLEAQIILPRAQAWPECVGSVRDTRSF